MIKINKVHSPEFIGRYIDFSINKVLLPKIAELIGISPPSEQVSISDFFNEHYLRFVLTAPPVDFENIIEHVYTRFPALAERYCYSYVLKDIEINESFKDLDLKSNKGKDEFDVIIKDIVDALTSWVHNKQVYLTHNHISYLSSDISRSNKRKYLFRLKNAKRGRSQITDKIKIIFPKWINKLEDCFDYGAISEQFGHEIAQSMGLNVCPYCGMEPIQTYLGNDISIRPDLDHFYPKTRFPFLAISLYNMIPSGPICNQKHKKNHPMLGYMHPCVDSLDNDNVFDFTYFPGKGILETLEINVHHQNDSCKKNNLSIFKIKPLYNMNEDLREWFKTAVELKDFFFQSGFDINKTPNDHPMVKATIDLTRPITKVTAQKFKVEAMNIIFKTNLQTIPQKK